MRLKLKWAKSTQLSLFFICCVLPVFGQSSPPKNPESIGSVKFTSAGVVSNVLQILPGEDFPPLFSSSDRDIFRQIRDGVYNGAPSEALESQATYLLKEVDAFPGAEPEKLLIRARIDYYIGRSWNDHKNKKTAIPWYEQAIASAQALIKLEGETPRALIAYAEPLGELSILKDVAFLVLNGPKVGQSAAKVLMSDPDNVRALLLQASALAYPPPIWGGNYKKALESYAHILNSAPSTGLPADVLFDIRVGIATAYLNLKYSDNARWWLNAARELYPNNLYANAELEKLKK